jgi:hypothetical protein
LHWVWGSRTTDDSQPKNAFLCEQLILIRGCAVESIMVPVLTDEPHFRPLEEQLDRSLD